LGTPQITVKVEAEPIALSTEDRDWRSLSIMAILRDHDLLPPEVEDVIDVETGRRKLLLSRDNSSRADLGPQS
jgi:hypothetical protein